MKSGKMDPPKAAILALLLLVTGCGQQPQQNPAPAPAAPVTSIGTTTSTTTTVRTTGTMVARTAPATTTVAVKPVAPAGGKDNIVLTPTDRTQPEGNGPGATKDIAAPIPTK